MDRFVSVGQTVTMITNEISRTSFKNAAIQRRITINNGHITVAMIHKDGIEATLSVDLARLPNPDRLPMINPSYHAVVTLHLKTDGLSPKDALIAVALFREMSETGARIKRSLEGKVIVERVSA